MAAKRVLVALAAAATAVLVTALAGPSAQQPGPDIVFVNGEIITMEAEQPRVTALAVSGDRILAIGADADMRALAGPATVEIDLEGRMMIPGFVDAHTHLFNDRWFWNASLAEIQDLALRNGITTLGNMYSTPEFVEEMRAFARSGELLVRTNLYLSRTSNCGDDLGDWYVRYAPEQHAGSRLRIVGIKVFADGGSCGRPAISFPYADTGEFGDLFHTDEALFAMVADGHRRGYQVAIHAQGDVAIDQALEAIEAALDGQPNTQRHRIEHNAFIRDDQLPRYSEIGIVPTLFGTYFTCFGITDGGYAQIFGEEHLDWLENWRRFLDANPGLIAAWHGDDPGVLPVSPILEFYGFVTRSQLREETGEVCAAPDWLRAFGVSPDEALRMMTINAAYALFMDDAVGSIRAGKFADMVILSDNLLDVPAEAIPDVTIEATILGGRAEYCEDGVTICELIAAAPGVGGAPDHRSGNIARNKPVSASAALAGNEAAKAIDGDIETWWGAGDGPLQWIEIDLSSPRAIASISLSPSQSPAGETVHVVLGRRLQDEAFRELAVLEGVTSDLDTLTVTPSAPWDGVRYLRIETIESPSWVSWREIAIFAAD